jgi:hypothetical protein
MQAISANSDTIAANFVSVKASGISSSYSVNRPKMAEGHPVYSDFQFFSFLSYLVTLPLSSRGLLTGGRN